ncbi:MAG: nuclease-related domain-containing protein, partial [Aeromonas sp.]|uniref:nuclease-related domain-containing protein n=1 Tax=Aeromonas sp. TaxID=647 RepID=UPI003D6C09CC
MYIVNPLNPDILTDGERYTLEQKLKKLLVDEDCFIYVQPIINELKPDFIVIGKKFGVLIIEVKDWDDDYIQSANPNYVISKTNKKYRNPISQVNHYSSIVHSKLNGIEEFFDSNGNLIIPISM